MKRYLISSLGSFVLLSCGISNHNDSHPKDVTDPSEQVVGSAREFWYYEAEVDGLNAAAHRLRDSAITYFPESYSNGDDFFWTFMNTPSNSSNLEFKLSMDPEITRSVPVMNNVAANGQIVSMQLTPDTLSQILEYPRWQIDFQPVFYVKAKGADIPLELTVSIKNVCYNPHFFDIGATLELDLFPVLPSIYRQSASGDFAGAGPSHRTWFYRGSVFANDPRIRSEHQCPQYFFSLRIHITICSRL